VYGQPSQLPWSRFRADISNDINIPIYATHDLSTQDQWHVEHAIIILHGNLRNANDYFCAGLTSIAESADPSKYLIIVPQFLVVGDNCWENGILNSVTNDFSCGYPVFGAEGWKDGAANLFGISNGGRLFSYDYFNLIINRLADPVFFPSIKRMTIFGFSAGAQVLQRFAVMPKYSILNSHISLHYVISDPSTYLYFSKLRPYTNGGGFGVPDPRYLS
jgi:hypothetical protein